MEAITAALERLRQPGLQIEADIAFHRAVARATDNNYITTFVNFISEQVRTSIAIAQEKLDPAVNARILSTEHGAIHDAILTRRPSLARAAMRRHISNAAAGSGSSRSAAQPCSAVAARLALAFSRRAMRAANSW